MPNAYIPRLTVHDWSEDMSENPDNHQAALNRLLKDQRRVLHFIQENAESMDPMTGQVATYLCGVIMRMFDMAGGRLRSATWAQVREAEAKIQGAVGELLPLDDKLPERARKVAWRAQPHILDEALMSLFIRPKQEQEQEVNTEEAVKIYLLMWVTTEVLDANWRPAKDFGGESEYKYVKIEPKAKAE